MPSKSKEPPGVVETLGEVLQQRTGIGFGHKTKGTTDMTAKAVSPGSWILDPGQRTTHKRPPPTSLRSATSPGSRERTSNGQCPPSGLRDPRPSGPAARRSRSDPGSKIQKRGEAEAIRGPRSKSEAARRAAERSEPKAGVILPKALLPACRGNACTSCRSRRGRLGCDRSWPSRSPACASQ